MWDRQARSKCSSNNFQRFESEKFEEEKEFHESQVCDRFVCHPRIHQFFSSDTNCRFCLRKFKEDEKQVEINSYIRKQFHVLTQTELKISKVYSDQICESCFNAVRDSMTLRRKLLDNQKTLEKAFGDFEEVKGEEDTEITRREESPQVEQVNLLKSCNVSVKIEELSEDENRFPDGSLEKVKKEDEGRLGNFEFMSKKSKNLVGESSGEPQFSRFRRLARSFILTRVVRN
jgi:hypothetical protein